MEKIKVEEILNNKDFKGIILSKELIAKLGIAAHPFLKITIENEIVNKGEKIKADFVGCVTHEEGWGFINL